MSKTASRNRKNIWLGTGASKTASNRPLLSRLLGLETEYALYLDTKQSDLPFPMQDWFAHVVAMLSKQGPVVPSRRDEQTYFMANGGNVSFETNSLEKDGRGFLEGATPECTSPLSLLTYQMMQDQLFSETTQTVFGEIDAKLLKNSCDASGRLHGQQENYEVDVASGWRLAAWRLGLLLLLPLLLAYKVFSRAWLTTMCFLSIVSRSMTWVSYHARIRLNELRGKFDREKWLLPEQLIVEDWTTFTPTMMRVAVIGMRVLHAPLAIALQALTWSVALVPYRRYLIPFLASRAIFDGAGHVDASGKYHISVRALHCTGILGLGSYWGERPALVTGHWLKALCTDPWYSLDGWFRLFRRKQRVQISLGDATTNHATEYLRIGTTALVLDLIECGRLEELPQLSDPLAAIRGFASDWMLLHRTPDRRRMTWNALEIQRSYLQAVRRLLQNHWQVPVEAWQILNQWDFMIEQLQAGKNHEAARSWLLGRVDWFSKKWLIDQVPLHAPIIARKKIDLRYHEVSDEGYQQRMMLALKLPELVENAQVQRARRLPPTGTPAAQRAYLIREFAMTDATLRVDWDGAEYGSGSERRVVRFRRPK